MIHLFLTCQANFMNYVQLARLIIAVNFAIFENELDQLKEIEILFKSPKSNFIIGVGYQYYFLRHNYSENLSNPYMRKFRHILSLELMKNVFERVAINYFLKIFLNYFSNFQFQIFCCKYTYMLHLKNIFLFHEELKCYIDMFITIKTYFNLFLLKQTRKFLLFF